MDFFITDAKKIDGAVPVEAGSVQCLHGIEPDQQAGLHVAGPGAHDLVAMEGKGPGGGGAHGKDRVGMAQQHDALRTLALAHGEQIIAQRRLRVAMHSKPRLPRRACSQSCTASTPGL